uniref:Uncharacterized protein n=1 Tax=Oryza barthii TaxID=65489 RepID=A0A0D3GD15_9ORYZ
MYTLRGLTPVGKLFNLTGEFSSTSHTGGNKKQTTKEQCTLTPTPIPCSLVYERDAQGTKQTKCNTLLQSVRFKSW